MPTKTSAKTTTKAGVQVAKPQDHLPRKSFRSAKKKDARYYFEIDDVMYTLALAMSTDLALLLEDVHNSENAEAESSRILRFLLAMGEEDVNEVIRSLDQFDVQELFEDWFNAYAELHGVEIETQDGQEALGK